MFLKLTKLNKYRSDLVKNEFNLLAKPYTTVNNYKKIGLYVALGITCTWKCEDCINIHYKDIHPRHHTNSYELINSYLSNPLLSSLILSGLEPFDSFDSMLVLIENFRKFTKDDIVIFTGYTEEELFNKINLIKNYNNIIIKFGRYMPSKPPVFDNILGIHLISDNQFAKKY